MSYRPSSAFPLAPLFDLVPNACLFTKDPEGRFLQANQTFMELVGVQEEAEVVGKTDYDFFPHDLVKEYREEDFQVMETGVPVLNRPWLVCDASGRMDWFVSSKIPLLLVVTPVGTRETTVVGIAGFMHDIQRAGEAFKPYHEMQEVVDHIFSHYATPIRNEELARMVHLSVSQFNRRFRALFRVSPQSFVQAARIRMAKRLLVSSDMSVASVALETGFYDQSSFCKQFRRQTSLTPKEYRKSLRGSLEVAGD